MRLYIAFLLFCAEFPLRSQTNQTPASNPNILGVKPGTEAIESPELYQGHAYWHPFGRMAKFVLRDQKAIWTSPFHTGKSDIKYWAIFYWAIFYWAIFYWAIFYWAIFYWAIFGAATGGFIMADQHIAHAAPNTPGLRTLGTDISYLGAFYTALPRTAGFYFLGTARGDERFRETGLLGFEILADAGAVDLALKIVTDRERPEQDSMEGHCEEGPARWNSSFPSGHATSTFALASVFAHEYHNKTWVKIVVYAYAAGVVGARLAANQHFPGDTLAGGAIGWFIGDYVYAKRHNPALDGKRTLSEKILAHVRIGSGF
jgi:membrane-associated phospholipid phosphatase